MFIQQQLQIATLCRVYELCSSRKEVENGKTMNLFSNYLKHLVKSKLKYI